MSETENKRVADPGEPAPEGLGSGTSGRYGNGEAVSGRKPDLEEMVRAFIGEVEQRYPVRMKRRPRALKERTLQLIRRHFPPYPKPAGRPNRPDITLATAMYLEQQKEIQAGSRDASNWRPILRACLPHALSRYRESVETQRMRNAVYARLKRQSQKRTGRRSRSKLPDAAPTPPAH
jgi:hypothetical protein